VRLSRPARSTDLTTEAEAARTGVEAANSSGTFGFSSGSPVVTSNGTDPSSAVLAGVGTLIYAGTEHRVGNGEVGPLTRALRAALIAVQQGEAPDRHGWLERV